MNNNQGQGQGRNSPRPGGRPPWGQGPQNGPPRQSGGYRYRQGGQQGLNVNDGYNNNLSFPPTQPYGFQPPQDSTFNRKRVTLSELEGILASCAKEDLAADLNVSVARLMNRSAAHLGYARFEDIGFSPKQVPLLERLIPLENRVATMIGAFAAHRSVATLQDLELEIVESEQVSSFEDLRLGPLVRHPMVISYFGFLQSTKTPEYTLKDFAVDLIKITKKRQGKTKERLNPSEVVTEIGLLKEIDPRELGFRINGLGLALSVCWQLSNTETQIWRKVKLKAEKERENELLDSARLAVMTRNIEAPERPAHLGIIRLLDEAAALRHNMRIKNFLKRASPKEIVEMAAAWLGLVETDEELCAEEAQALIEPVHKFDYDSFMERCRRGKLIGASWEERINYLNAMIMPAGKAVLARKQWISNAMWLGCGLLALCYFMSSACPEREEAVPSEVDLVQAVVRQVQDSTLESAVPEGNVEDYNSANCISNTSSLVNYFVRVEQHVLNRFSFGTFSYLNGSNYSFMKWIALHKEIISAIEEKIKDSGITLALVPKGEIILDEIDTRNESEQDVAPINFGPKVCSLKIEKAQLLREIASLLEGEGIELKDSLLDRLAAIERILAARHDVRDVAQLGHGNILSLLCGDPRLRTLVGSLDICSSVVCNKADIAEIAGLLVQAFGQSAMKKIGTMRRRRSKLTLGLDEYNENVLNTNNELNEFEVERIILSHYALTDIRDLGLGSLPRLLREVSTYISSRSFSPCTAISFTVALTASGKADRDGLTMDTVETGPKPDQITHPTNHLALKADKGLVGVLGEQDKDAAIDAIMAAPLMVDLALHTQWELVFGSSLGSIGTFLVMNANALERKGAQLLATDHQSWVKVDPKGSPDTYFAYLRHGNATGSAACLGGVASGAGHVSLIPFNLLGLHTQTAVMGLASGLRPDGSVDPCHDPMKANVHASTVMLQVIQSLPLTLLDILAGPVLLGPLRKTMPTILLSILDLAGENPTTLALLHRLGLQQHANDWLTHYQAHCLNSKSPMNIGVIITHSPTVVTDQLQSTAPNTIQVKESIGDTGLDPNVPVIPIDSRDIEVMKNTEAVALEPNLEVENLEVENAQLLIAQIRRERFGRDVVLEGASQAIVLQQNGMIARALGRLSRDLYSKDSHFVLELVQNADDNSYGPFRPGQVASCPTIHFVLEAGRIIVLNNEHGFSARNMQALCDVGNSTKSGQTSGYIGQKGIGFKSVFRVSNRPEIHSNGFHVCFNREEDDMGYVMPTWIGAGPTSHLYKAWGTRIELPLTAEMAQRRIELVGKFTDLHPAILLFLHRLDCIVVDDPLAGKVITMSRRKSDCGYMEVELQQQMTLGQVSTTSSTIAQWLLIKKSFQVPEGLREGVMVTEVILAFPALNAHQAHHPNSSSVGDTAESHKTIHIQTHVPFMEKDRPPQQPVFAFLPLRSYGLRFVVQGDFLLPSSREDVDVDSAWNQWVRSLLVPLFLEAVERMKVEGNERANREVSESLAVSRGPSGQDARGKEQMVMEETCVNYAENCLDVETMTNNDEEDILENTKEGNEVEGQKLSSRKRKSKSKNKWPSKRSKMKKEEDDNEGETYTQLQSLPSGNEQAAGQSTQEETSITQSNVNLWNIGLTATKIFQFVPLEGEVTGFFRPVVKDIMHGLKGLQCVPTAGGLWALPSQVVFLEDPDVHCLTTDQDMVSCLGLYPLHPQCLMSPALRASLGIASFGPPHLLRTVRHRLSSRNPPTVQWMSQWLCSMYRAMDRLSPIDRASLLATLADMQIVPLTSGEWARISDHPIFFPIALTSQSQSQSHSSPAPCGFETRLRIVSESLFGEVIGLKHSIVVDMLESMGVQPPLPDNIIAHHILPSLQAASTLSLADWDLNLVASYALYLRKHPGWNRLKLQEVLLVSTNQGCRKLAGQPVHFPRNLGNKTEIDAVLPDELIPQWLVLSDHYMQLDSNITAWRQFFHSLGVQDFVIPTEIHSTMKTPLPPPWNQDSRLADIPPDTIVTIHDYTCLGLQNLLTAAVKLDPIVVKPVLLAVQRALQAEWDHQYGFALQAKVSVTGEDTQYCVSSSFIRILTDIPWVCGQDGQLHYGHNLYASKQRRILGNNLGLFAKDEPTENVRNAIGMVENITPVMLAEALVEWSLNQPFTASLERMVAVYKELSIGLDSQVLEILKTHKVIWMPSARTSVLSVETEGAFYGPDEVCVKDRSGIIELKGGLKALSTYYTSSHADSSPLKESDVQLVMELMEALGVAAEPHRDTYLQTLQSICTGSVTELTRDYALRILSVWADSLAECHMTPVDVLTLATVMQIRTTPCFPTVQNTWMHLKRSAVFLADDPVMTSHFSKFQDISLLQLPCSSTKNGARLYDFFRALEIPFLSEAIHCQVKPTVLRYGTPLTHHILSAIPLIQKYMATRDLTRYKRVMESGICERISQLVCAEADQLEMVMSLGNHQVVQLDLACALDNLVLYVNGSHRYGPVFWDAVAEQFSRLFYNGSMSEALASFIAYFLASNMSEEEIDGWLKKRNISNYPEGDDVWRPNCTVNVENNIGYSANGKEQEEESMTGNGLVPIVNSNEVNQFWNVPRHNETRPLNNIPSQQPLSQSSHGGVERGNAEINTYGNEMPLNTSQGNMPDWKPRVSAYEESVGNTAVIHQGTTPSPSPCNITMPPPLARENSVVSIGRWGEEFVFSMLCQQYGKERVKWVNQELETGLPYDILLTVDKGGGGRPPTVTFVEVKATTARGRETFHLSEREFRMADREGDRYMLALVYGAGREGSRVRMITSPAQKWRDKMMDILLYAPLE